MTKNKEFKFILSHTRHNSKQLQKPIEMENFNSDK